QYGPLYAAAETPPSSICALQAADASRPFTKADHDEDQRARQDINNKGYTLVPTSKVSAQSKLTNEEKLLIAQEKRGRVVPDEAKRKLLVQQAHANGHYGEKAMQADIDRKGYWWPNIRKDLSDEIKVCPACQRFSTTRAGYEPARSIFAARPGDHYQMDLCQFPASAEGYKFC